MSVFVPAVAVSPELARDTLFAFLATFVLARIVVLAIMLRLVPNLYLHMGRTHVHHLNYGIVLLTLVGGVLLFARPQGTALQAAGIAYGIAVALTYDEFGMWFHLGGPYWQRASFDAITVIAATLTLVALAPALERWRPAHWWTAGTLLAALVAFGWLLVKSLRFASARVSPVLRNIEAGSPR